MICQQSAGELLQFGHAGEGVETARAFRAALAAWQERLQFGHAGEGVETSKGDVLPNLTRAGFNSATPVKAWRLSRYGSTTKNTWWLQFGHAGEGVETSRLRRHPRRALRRFNSATPVKAWRPEKA